MNIPEGISDDRLRGGMKKQGIVVSGGQDALKGKIFRIGTMGVCSSGDILRTIQALELIPGQRGQDSILRRWRGGGKQCAEEYKVFSAALFYVM